MSTAISRVLKLGTSSAVIIPKAQFELLGWNVNDRVVLRVAGDKLVVERIPIEKYGIVRTGTPEERRA